MVKQTSPFILLPLAAAIGLTPAAMARDAVGVTLAARGDVEAIDLLDLEPRVLSRRSDVFDVDTVITGSGSQAQIRMVDDAVLALRADSEVVIAEYQYNEETGEGRAIMELVSGGLRTLSGSISPDSENSDYELRTDVGSIGIRGTHYEVVQTDGELFMGVWEGEIEFSSSVGEGGDPVVLGTDSDYSFASVGEDGEITYYLEPPEVFAEGYADDDEEPEEDTDSEDEDVDEDEGDLSDDEDDEDEEAEDEGDEEDSEPDDTDAEDDDADEDPVDDESDEDDGLDLLADGDDDEDADDTAAAAPATDIASAIETGPASDPIVLSPINLPTPPGYFADRTGTAVYNDLIDFDLEGTRTDYDMTLTFEVNFTQGTINDGYLELVSPNDGDTWTAGFYGGFIGNEIQIGPVIGDNQFTYATHNNNLAEGSMNAMFFGSSAEQVRGDFSLNEVENPNVNVSGDYVVGQ